MLSNFISRLVFGILIWRAVADKLGKNVNDLQNAVMMKINNTASFSHMNFIFSFLYASVSAGFVIRTNTGSIYSPSASGYYC